MQTHIKSLLFWYIALSGKARSQLFVGFFAKIFAPLFQTVIIDQQILLLLFEWLLLLIVFMVEDSLVNLLITFSLFVDLVNQIDDVLLGNIILCCSHLAFLVLQLEHLLC